MTSELFTAIVTAASAFFGAMASVAFLGFWLATRFNNVYTKIHDSANIVIEKIGAHEKLDDERFNRVDLAIMRIELALQTQGNPAFKVPSG